MIDATTQSSARHQRMEPMLKSCCYTKLIARSMLLVSMIMNSQDSTLLLVLLSLIPIEDLSLVSFLNMLTWKQELHPGQLEWFKTQVDDDSKIVGGKQCIESLEGYALPVSIDSGKGYLHPVCPPTNTNGLQLHPPSPISCILGPILHESC